MSRLLGCMGGMAIFFAAITDKTGGNPIMGAFLGTVIGLLIATRPRRPVNRTDPGVTE